MTAHGARVAAEAADFLAGANARLLDLSVKAEAASFAYATDITPETEQAAADRERERLIAAMELATEASRFDTDGLPDDLARQLGLIIRCVRLPMPQAMDEQVELTRTLAALAGDFGRGRYGDRDLNALSAVMAESREAETLLDAWRGWRSIARPMRGPYQRCMELANRGARGLGFADLGEVWRSGYDMTADAFAAEMDRLWRQVRPFYDALHTYTARRLARFYRFDIEAGEGLIPAHLLGNMWGDSWANVYPLVAAVEADGELDLTARLRAMRVDRTQMVRFGEQFFTSLGFEPLPATFWERSMFTKPVDRDVMCHPTAWDIDADLDLRMSFCIEITGDDFITIHHELGHNLYFRAYRHQPYLFRDGANDGFHEAIGDAITLSMTPAYLNALGLLDVAPDRSDGVPFLLRTALERIPYLAFAMALETWRWNVFSGAIATADYNRAWWELAKRYQRIAPPTARSEADFDPAAKYHVSAMVPVAPYFIALILQFQFHRAFARSARFTGPLHEYSVHGDRSAGERLAAMLAMGRSRPWPEALYALTGEREMDATALLEYFAPLHRWLDDQNRNAGARRS